MERTHQYSVTSTWTGDRGTGTSGYRDFDRDHETTADGAVVDAHRRLDSGKQFGKVVLTI